MKVKVESLSIQAPSCIQGRTHVSRDDRFRVVATATHVTLGQSMVVTCDAFGQSIGWSTVQCNLTSSVKIFQMKKT